MNNLNKIICPNCKTNKKFKSFNNYGVNLCK